MTASHVVDRPAELLEFLFTAHTGAKKNTVRQWLKYGQVLVNGAAQSHAKHLLNVGDVVSIEPKGEVRPEGLLPATMKVLFEDAAILVIDKPANLLSVGTDKENEKTAYKLLNHFVRGGNLKSPNHVWVVHRLDRETSGVMVFGKTEAAKLTLQAAWGQVQKYYLAIVEGAPVEPEGTISNFLDEQGPYKVFSVPESERTRHAVTHYRVVQKTPLRTLIELRPETGRRNQIRVHLADLGCPIVGDHKYDAKTNPAKRLALHASALEFPHPTSGEKVRFESPLPKVLARLV